MVAERSGTCLPKNCFAKNNCGDYRSLERFSRSLPTEPKLSNDDTSSSDMAFRAKRFVFLLIGLWVEIRRKAVMK